MNHMNHMNVGEQGGSHKGHKEKGEKRGGEWVGGAHLCGIGGGRGDAAGSRIPEKEEP